MESTTGAAPAPTLDYGFAGCGLKCLEPVCKPLFVLAEKHNLPIFRPRFVLVVCLLLMVFGLVMERSIFDASAPALYGLIGAIAGAAGVLFGTFWGVIAYCDDKSNMTSFGCCYCIDCNKLCGGDAESQNLCATLYIDALALALVIGGATSSLITLMLIQFEYTKLHITFEMMVYDAVVFGLFWARNYVKTQDGWLDELKTATDGKKANDWKALL